MPVETSLVAQNTHPFMLCHQCSRTLHDDHYVPVRFYVDESGGIVRVDSKGGVSNAVAAYCGATLCYASVTEEGRVAITPETVEGS